MNLLFLTAHYDDLEVSAGGTAARYGGAVLVLFPKDTHGTRAEAEASAEVLGVELLAEFPDDATEREMVHAIGAVVSAFDCVIATSPYDSHPEHRQVAGIARQVARKNDVGLWFMDHAIPGGYSGSAPRPNHFVTFDSRDKYHGIACFPVLLEGDRYAITARDEYYGGLVGSSYAEGFIIERSTQ